MLLVTKGFHLFMKMIMCEGQGEKKEEENKLKVKK
jgi:hypothetical protein